MGALAEFFGFEGRVNRIGYLWRFVVIGLLLLLMASAGTFVMTAWLAPRGVMGETGALNIVLTAVYLLSLWSGFALSTRRLRDMGLEPVHIVPLYAAFWVVNAVLVEPMSRIDPNDFRMLEDGWIAAHWLAALPLLFWPSSARHDAVRPRYEPAEPTAYLNWRQSG